MSNCLLSQHKVGQYCAIVIASKKARCCFDLVLYKTGKRSSEWYIYICVCVCVCLCVYGGNTPQGHLPPITKTIQVRRARHAGHCWRSKDELISDVLPWTPAYGQAKAGRPARTYIQQLCEDTGCSPEDLPEAMNDREKWQERVRDIRASDTTWWWWWYIYVCVCVRLNVKIWKKKIFWGYIYLYMTIRQHLKFRFYC